jgi:hypothetical protein
MTWAVFDEFTFFSGTYVLRPSTWTGGQALVELLGEDATYYEFWLRLIVTDSFEGITPPGAGRAAIAPQDVFTYRHRAAISANTAQGTRRLSYRFPLRARLFGRTIRVWRLPP